MDQSSFGISANQGHPSGGRGDNWSTMLLFHLRGVTLNEPVTSASSSPTFVQCSLLCDILNPM